MDLCEVWTHSLWKVRVIKIQFFNNFEGVLSIDLEHAGLNTFNCLVFMMEAKKDIRHKFLKPPVHPSRYSICHKNCLKLSNAKLKKQGRKSILKFEEGTLLDIHIMNLN